MSLGRVGSGATHHAMRKSREGRWWQPVRGKASRKGSEEVEEGSRHGGGTNRYRSGSSKIGIRRGKKGGWHVPEKLWVRLVGKVLGRV